MAQPMPPELARRARTASPPSSAADGAAGARPCKCWASCRAVGWSNISVLDSVILSPTARCSWLRSSTAPSESTPASINGASASTALPAVRCTRSSTAERDKAAVSRTAGVADCRTHCERGAMSLRKAGTGPPPPSMRPHCTGITPSTDAAHGCVATRSAPRPCARLIRPRPAAASIAAMRSLAMPRAAIPISAHAPHCTLAPTRPQLRETAANASRHAFAAL